MLHSREASSSNASDRPGTLKDWAQYLRAIASTTIESIDIRRDLAVALKRPYSFDAPVMLHAAPDIDFDDTLMAPKFILDTPAKHRDLYLWWALSIDSLDPMRVIDPAGDGPLIPRENETTTIEVWTETELASLHALTNHAMRHDDAQLVARIHRAIGWHLENTQPDNATAHPWAAHAFLIFDSLESTHFAETLVSNALVQNARPDPLSAWLLIDAARSLDGSGDSMQSTA